MKTLLARSSLFFATVLPLAASAQQEEAFALNRQSPNLLGNGGFEAWSLGSSSMGPVAPDLWYAMGSTTNVFTQSDIEYTRSPEDCTANPPWVAELTAVDPANFVAQSLENAGEFRGEWVTFAVDIRTGFSVALPHIEIFDGFNASVFSDIVFGGTPVCNQSWKRYHVSHFVDPSATMLELRIYPDQTVQVNDAMLVLGRDTRAPYVPRRNLEPGLMQLPLGAIIDWYRMDPGTPVPEGFAIADGSVVTDPGSPFVGNATPDLSDRFVKGVVSPAAIGTTGGSSTADLSHTHSHPHTHSGTTDSAQSQPWWYVSQIISPLQCSQRGHRHTFTTGNPNNSNTQSALDTPVSIEPQYIGLLKLMRIK